MDFKNGFVAKVIPVRTDCIVELEKLSGKFHFALSSLIVYL